MRKPSLGCCRRRYTRLRSPGARRRVQAEEIARLLNKKGNIAIMVGELGTGPAEPRPEGVAKVFSAISGYEGSAQADWQLEAE